MMYVYLYTFTTPGEHATWQCVVPENVAYDLIVTRCLKATNWKFATGSCKKIPFLEDL